MSTDHPQYRAKEVCDEMDHVALINLADWCGSSSETHDAAMGLPVSGSVHLTGKVYTRDANIIYSALESVVARRRSLGHELEDL